MGGKRVDKPDGGHKGGELGVSLHATRRRRGGATVVARHSGCDGGGSNRGQTRGRFLAHLAWALPLAVVALGAVALGAVGLGDARKVGFEVG